MQKNEIKDALYKIIRVPTCMYIFVDEDNSFVRVVPPVGRLYVFFVSSLESRHTYTRIYVYLPTLNVAGLKTFLISNRTNFVSDLVNFNLARIKARSFAEIINQTFVFPLVSSIRVLFSSSTCSGQIAVR